MLLSVFAALALRAMLYGIGPRDPLTVLGSGALLTARGARRLPSRTRILRLDVVNALRVDG